MTLIEGQGPLQCRSCGQNARILARSPLRSRLRVRRIRGLDFPLTIWAAFAQTLRNAAQRHLIQDLGTLGGPSSIGNGINASARAISPTAH